MKLIRSLVLALLVCGVVQAQTAGPGSASHFITPSNAPLGSFATLSALQAQYPTGSVPAGVTAYTGDNGPVYWNGSSWIQYATGAGGLTSVGLSMPSVFTVGNTPLIANGTLGVTFATGQTANQVLATPDGTTGAAGLRALVSNDLPAGTGTGSLVRATAPTFATSVSMTGGGGHAWSLSPTFPGSIDTLTLQNANATRQATTMNFNAGTINFNSIATGGTGIYGDTQFQILPTSDIEMFSKTSSSFDVSVGNQTAGATAKTTISTGDDQGEGLYMVSTSSTWSGALFTGGPSGEQEGLLSDLGFTLGLGGKASLYADLNQNLVSYLQSTTATDTNGFFYVPSVAALPTGVPANLTGVYAHATPLRYDTADNKLCLYNSGWQCFVSGPFPSAANPSGLVGLTAANGVATTFERSDATHALDQSIAPTWTGIHTFTNSDVRLLGSSTGYTTFTSANAGASNFTLTFPALTDTLATLGTSQTFTANQEISETEPRVLLNQTGAGADGKLWDIDVAAGILTVRTRTDADGVGQNVLAITRGTGTAVSDITFGDAADNTTLHQLGTGGLNLPGGITCCSSAGSIITSRVNVNASSVATNGMYLPAANTVGLSSNSVLRVSINTATVTSTLPYVAPVGAVGTPAFTFTGDTTNGLYRIGSNDWGLAANGALQLEIAASAVKMPTLAASSAAQTGTVCWSSTGGNLTVDTTVACLASTRKIKQNIRPLDIGLAEVMKMKPVSYDLKPKFNPMHLGPQVGLVAEDVQQVDPRLVALDDKGDPRGVRYMQMTAVLIKAIQEQQAEIDGLKRQLARTRH